MIILLLLFLTSLFVDPSTRGGSKGTQLGAVLPIVLVTIRATVGLVPKATTSMFNNVCRCIPVRAIIGSVLGVNALVIFLVTRR